MFPSDLELFIKESHVLNKDGELKQVTGASTYNNCVALYNLIKKYKPQNTLEIGLAFGISAYTILYAHQKNNLPNFTHTAIDPYQALHMGNAGLMRVAKNEWEQHFVFFENYSELVLPELLKTNIKYDLIYIDGSHLFENVFLDFFYSSRLLNNEGIILFDDSSDKEVKKTLKFIKANYKDRLEEINLLPFLQANGLKKLFYPLARIFFKVQLRAFKKINPSINREWQKFKNF